MASAFTHVGADTLRTLAVFVAALVSVLSSASGSACDAVAAMVVTVTIVAAVIPLMKEIYAAYYSILAEPDPIEINFFEVDDVHSHHSRSHSRAHSRGSRVSRLSREILKK